MLAALFLPRLLTALLAGTPAFAWSPEAHAPRAQAPRQASAKPFYISDARRITPEGELAFQPIETAAPVVDPAGTRLYVATHDGKLRCLYEGRTAFVYFAAGPMLASPLLDGETLFVADGGGRLAALNRITGAVRWSVELREPLTTTPTLADGRLFVMSGEQSLTALDSENGKTLWKFHRDAPAGFQVRGDARPRVAHGTVFAGFANGEVIALNPPDGVAKWLRNVSGTGDYLDVDDLQVDASDDRIYAASAKAGVVALDWATGNTVWSFALPGANHLLLDGTRIYVSGREKVVAVDRSSGSTVWSVPLERDRQGTALAQMQGLVLVSQERGPLLAIDAGRGKLRAAFDPGSGFSMGAAVVPGAAYIVSDAATLFTLGLVP